MNKEILTNKIQSYPWIICKIKLKKRMKLREKNLGEKLKPNNLFKFIDFDKEKLRTMNFTCFEMQIFTQEQRSKLSSKLRST